MKAARKKVCPFLNTFCKGKLCIAYKRGGNNITAEWMEYCNVLPRGNQIGWYEYSEDDKPKGQ